LISHYFSLWLLCSATLICSKRPGSPLPVSWALP
jgi:hypothetical protein